MGDRLIVGVSTDEFNLEKGAFLGKGSFGEEENDARNLPSFGVSAKPVSTGYFI